MYKSKLQELCHQCSWDLPEYVTVKEGPDHRPRFTATCTIRGIPFESPKSECKSSKEAQNLAAKIAFDHLSALQFTAVPPSVASPSPSSLPSPGFVFSASKNLNVQQTEGEQLLQKNSQTPLPDGAPSACTNLTLPKHALHLYKNRLQHFTQKKSLSLPEYSCESDGPPHARRFRATVIVDGRAYQTTEYFPTLREAEHAAARIAFESLSEGAIQEDESLYKSLLQELAQRKDNRLPSYDTEKTGPTHAPAFKSKVEIGGLTFYGAECKSKKLAEMNAAKVAFNALIEHEVLKNDHLLSPCKNKAVEVSPVLLDSVVSHDLQVDMQRKSEAGGNNGEDTGKEPSAKKCKYSASPDDKPFLPEMFPLTNAVCHCASSDAEKAVGSSDTPGPRIVVYSHESNMTIPDGGSVLPCSNDKWLVMSMEVNRDR